MIVEKLQKDMTQALKNGDKPTLSVLRMILSQINYARIDKKEDLSDDELILLLRKEIKKRQESVVLYKKGQREELAEKELQEIAVIKKYLPEEISEEELIKIINKIADSGGGDNPGKLIGMVLAEVKGKADGSRVAALVKERIKK
ncbi:MAG: hypothetical protein UV73_C0003G0133 [Candidatus Gottesmanbacteria bacterium GW2011_GWA2_43_14]|uniref:GatB/YqeY domain-containing protein n=1 Tax=Candidatus Gottesmanbacteria bacterium GW2011_GWA2_43_14 TaxID=1618443 RepID=A0A0G1FT51_9BACT|nr:MAG: hypothetical protein UV73_C0003G0133 [Candidatus Gottesmanbacteria bacterium GW2011_GWA2_43_14]